VYGVYAGGVLAKSVNAIDPLFPYQKIGAEWLSARKLGCLYDEQGVGKSAQAIRACELLNARRVLVICRAVAVENWKNEFRKWFRGGDGSSGGSRDGNGGGRLAAGRMDSGWFLLREAAILVTSYESLEKNLRLVDEGAADRRAQSGQQLPVRFDALIVDEAHYLKEPTAKRTRAVLGKTGVIHRAKHTWLLTGTPVPNHAGELWTTLFTFGRTGIPYNDFVERFCTYRDTGFGRQITGTNSARAMELKQLINPICLRRTKEQVLSDLPPIFYQDVVVEPGAVEIGYCRTFARYILSPNGVEELAADLEREMGILNGILDEHLGKGAKFSYEALKAIEAHAKSIMTVRRYTGLQKIEPVIDLVSAELRADPKQKIVIFGVHRDTVEILRDRLAKEFGAVLVYGGSKPSRIQDRVEKFQLEPKCRVFIGNIQAAGTSITLTAADQVLFIEQSFVPGDMAQAAMRCHRVGQTRPVTVRFVGLANSIDQYIAEILRRKTAEIGQLMDGIGVLEDKPKTVNELF
jgi:SWI/SNF-related matrix-associated actin-dependent regulator 1 of chromatin subfamily A